MNNGSATLDVIKTTIYLETEVHRALRIAAIEDGVSMTELIKQGVHDVLEKRKTRKPR